MALERSSNKIPIDEFCKLMGLNRRQVHTLYKNHPGLKAQVAGERKSRVNMDVWDNIIRGS